VKVNLKANDLEGYREELFEFVESRQKEVMQLGMHLCMKGRDRTKPKFQIRECMYTVKNDKCIINIYIQ